MSKSLFNSLSIYLFANIINAGIPFFLLPVLTRVLSPADYGVVAMFNAVTSGLAALTGLSVHGAVAVNFFKMDRECFPQFVAVCFLILVVSSIVTAIIILILAPWLVIATGLNIKWLLIAVAISVAQFVINIRLVIWQNIVKPIKYSLLQFVQVILGVGISLYLVLILRWGATGRIWGSASAFLMCACIALITLQYNGWLKWRWNNSYAREALSYGVPLIPHVLGSILLVIADRFIINGQLGIEVTGIYFVAIQLASPIILIGESFNRGFRPWLYEKLSERKDADAVFVSYVAMAGFIIIGILYSVGLVYILPIIVGEKYHGHYRCIKDINHW